MCAFHPLPVIPGLAHAAWVWHQRHACGKLKDTTADHVVHMHAWKGKQTFQALHAELGMTAGMPWSGGLTHSGATDQHV
jgi:hypothetical protein